jgi:hypothetical protein
VRPYAELPNLDDLYLEDSWVLDVQETPDEVCFHLEAVLRETHPKWSPPKKGEVYTTLPLSLVFPGKVRVLWVERKMKPILGPDDEVDHGNIDSFEWEPRFFELQGEWGHVRIESDPPLVIEA